MAKQEIKAVDSKQKVSKKKAASKDTSNNDMKRTTRQSTKINGTSLKTKKAVKKENQKIKTPKIQNKPTPNTRSNTRKNKISRVNTFGSLDLLEQQPLSRKQKVEDDNESIYPFSDNEDISFTPTFGS